MNSNSIGKQIIHISMMIIVRRILLVACVSSVVIGITISLLAYVGSTQSDPSLRLYLGRRSLRNGENEVNVVVSASRRGGKFYDLTRFTEEEVRGEKQNQ